MGYFMRVFTPSEAVPEFDSLRAAVATQPNVYLSLEAGDEWDWTHLLLTNTYDERMTAIERTGPDRFGAREIDGYIEEIEGRKPVSAVKWLTDYLRTVKCVYAFQILSGTRTDEDWAAVYTVRDAIRDVVGGIMQADLEGFSNEEGFHILWQFTTSAKGMWSMAILQAGQWVPFRMELSNRNQREAFLRGEVPA